MSASNDGYLTKNKAEKRQRKHNRRPLGEDAEDGRVIRVSFKRYLQELEDETTDELLDENIDDDLSS